MLATALDTISLESVSLMEIFQSMFQSPVLFVTIVLTLGVIFVNGWTDAPNAIATCIGTRCMKVRSAIMMSAVFNLLGVIVMTAVSDAVVDTISKIVDFGDKPEHALVGLCAALVSIVVYSVAASVFGIPTSESHSLIAGLSGAAIAIQGSVKGINGGQWVKVLYGIVLSVGLGFFMGFIVCKIVVLICRNMDRRKTNKFFQGGQIFGAAAMSFMHGAQDGQKFIGVLLLGVAFCKNMTTLPNNMSTPLSLMILCSLVMAIGTSVGGEKIIKSVGMDMVKLEKFQGFSADLAGALCLLISSIFGLPVSTTHTKTCAIMGVGSVKRLSAINFGVVKEMVFTWIFTFPGCGIISFIMAKIFMVLFI